MPDNARIRQLLEQMLDSNGTAEEVCSGDPELLAEVRARWERVRRLEGQVEALFPTPGSAARAGAGSLRPPDKLPRIDGYDIQSVLGHGGMGIVYRARHLKLNRTVALKMLIAGAYAGRQDLARFAREAEAVAALRHPNIVQVYEVGDLEGMPFFTLEFVDGGNLARELAGRPQPARRAAELVTILAGAVQVAHGGGIIHRDLKPANILLTSDGTPKITDFGLAQRVEGGPDFTASGARVGTPSYMAPEQALGKANAIGPAVDVYALGAILYEMLTGRPPFKAETAAETERQVIAEEPAPPSRLNAKVPRDLETICLKCLHKTPARRYPSAQDLADDLRRFLEGNPVLARPVGAAERAVKWARRRPAAATVVVMLLALFGLALGGGLWLERQRAERREEKARQEGREWQAVEASLEQATAFQKQGRWPEARAALEAAPSLLETSAPAELRERVRQARADVAMGAELEEIRLRLSEGRKGSETISPEGLYAAAFRDYGIALTTHEPAEAAERVRNSTIRETLLTFLHDWLYWVSDANRDRLWAVLDRADDDQWRQEYRKALVAQDIGKLKVLATAPEAADQPPVVLSGLCGRLLGANHRQEALALLREAQQRHPADFWINYLLGHYWERERPHEAVGYFRAAVAIRSSSDQAYAMLGRALRGTGDTDAAIAAFRKALQLNPNCAVGKDLAMALAPRGGLEEARVAWEKVVERAPPDHDPWYGYAELCLYLGNEDAYRRARGALLNRFGETANDWITAERTGSACLLLPASGEELRRAVALADRAVALAEKSPEPRNPYVLFVKGLAEYRQGRPQQAVALLQDAAEKLPNRPGPRLVLALAQFQSGSPKEARKTLAAAVRAYNWSESPLASHTDPPSVWASHVLRREAEATILPHLPAFLRGDYQPRENDERLALLGICQFQRRYATAARLYADAFAADPHLADDLTTECLRRNRRAEHPGDPVEVFNAACRYLAARCAALAGCGLGKDGDKLSEDERTRWRKQAREWLRADLAMWAKMLDGDSRVERDVAKRVLMHWLEDPDLAGLREASDLEKLPPVEREDCRALWSDLDAVLKRARGFK